MKNLYEKISKNESMSGEKNKINYKINKILD